VRCCWCLECLTLIGQP